MVRFLTARQGVNINATTASGYTPLHQASQQGHSTIVSHLLDKGADPDLLTSVSKNIILYYFTSQSYSQLMDIRFYENYNLKYIYIIRGEFLIYEKGILKMIIQFQIS